MRALKGYLFGVAWLVAVAGLTGWGAGCSRATVLANQPRDAGGPQGGGDGASEGWRLLVPEVGAAEAPAQAGCSRDLHSRVDEKGNTLAECPADQACHAGVCVPACEAFATVRGNVGCDFVIPRPPIALFPTSCFAVFVANNWSRPAKLTVAQAETSRDVERFARISVAGQAEPQWPRLPTSGVPVEQVAVLFLEGGPTQEHGCPVEAAVETTTRIEQTGRGHAWHIVSDTPVSVYDISPYGGAASYLPSAGLVFPTTSWGQNYVAVVPMYQQATRDVSDPGVQWGQIIAAQDDTQVEIVPSTSLPSGPGVPAAPAGAVARFVLSAGETIQWSRGWGNPAPLEMTGSILSSNKPIGFVGGNDYLCIDSSTSHDGGCDSAHQQIPPVSALGSLYTAVPYQTRRRTGQEESIWYRIVGVQDGTILTCDPPVPGAPASLRQGQWVDFQATGAFVVSSQDDGHPFYLAQTMSGQDEDLPAMIHSGDEEFVNLVPPAQFLSSYVFFTDPTYTTTTLSLVQCDEGRGPSDVRIECLGTVTGWKPMDASGRCRWATVALVSEGKPVGGCQNGPQIATSEQPFGLVVWGLAPYASYAYPAGALMAPINQVVVPIVIP